MFDHQLNYIHHDEQAFVVSNSCSSVCYGDWCSRFAYVFCYVANHARAAWLYYYNRDAKACSLAVQCWGTRSRWSSFEESRVHRFKANFNVLPQWIWYYSVSGYQEEAAFLQGDTYTFKVQSNQGNVVSIPAKLVNPCTFLLQVELDWWI